MSLLTLPIRRPVAVAMFFLGIVLVGAVAWQRMPVELFPALAGDRPVIVPLFSPRIVRHFAGLTMAAQAVHVVAISAAAAAELQDFRPASVTVSQKPDACHMVRAIETCADRLTRVEGDRGAQ